MPLSQRFSMYFTQSGLSDILRCLNFEAWEVDDVVAVIVCLVTVAVWCKNALLSKPPAGYHLYFISPQQEDGLEKEAPTVEGTATRNINDHMDELKKNIIVFWGSQSGQSERLAKEFVRECTTRFGLAAMVADIDMFDFDQLANIPKERYVGFVVATYGEGDPTDNAVGLSDYLHALKSHRTKTLGQLQYFCFGLGSSQYQSYNRFVDFVDEALFSAGGRRIAPVGKLDEALRSNEPWLSWKEYVMRDLGTRFGKSEQPVTTQISRPTIFLVKSSNEKRQDSAEAHIAEQSPRHRQRTQIAEITEIHQFSNSSSGYPSGITRRQYLHVELSTKTTDGTLKYRTGDHLAIWPINPSHEVDLMASVFGWDHETMNQMVCLQVTGAIGDVEATIPLKTPTTRDSILRYQLDICGPLFPEVVLLLKEHCPDTAGKRYLERVLENRSCWEAALAEHLTCSQLMHRATPKQKWPQELFCALIQTLPNLRSRYYSIASSSAVSPESISLTVSVVQPQLPKTNLSFWGLTTGYLCSLCDEPGHSDASGKIPAEYPSTLYPNYHPNGPRGILGGRKVFAHVRSTPFNLPQSLDTPIIMFGAGSGIAPFRAFVQEHLSLKRSGHDVGLMILFFGCRSRDDLLYADLWQEAVDAKILEPHFAFSADPDARRKTYVQDLLRGDAAVNAQVAEGVLNQGAMVYICGSSNMARGVKGALDDILGGKSSVSQLKTSKRLHEDVWVS